MKIVFSINFFVVLFLLCFSASAEIICVKAKIKQNGKVKLTRSVAEETCPRGAVQIIDTADLTDPTIFGTGSDGDLNVTGEAIYDGTSEYDNINIPASAKLFMQSGTTLRCRGDLNIDGAIIILQNGATGGILNTNLSSAIALNPQIQNAIPSGGIGTYAGNGEHEDDSQARLGGIGGGRSYGDSTFIRSFLNPFPVAGGAGGGGALVFGAEGGGSVRIVCKGAINIASAGAISASGNDGPDCAGGGGGGMIILSSATSITNAGTVDVSGGTGGAIGAECAPGGGGAGGLVHFLAPSVTEGTVNVSGGAGVAGGAVIAVSPRTAGGGGGGSVTSQGGSGANILSGGGGNLTSPSNLGGDGYYLETLADKTHLMQ